LSELSDRLAQLDDALQSQGFPSGELLAPGVDEAAAREGLAGVSSALCQEALDWFGWHNGSVSGHPDEVLAPSGFALLSIEQSLAERATRAESARALAGLPPDPLPVDVFWRDSWLPIGRMSTAAVLVLDFASDAAAAPVYRVDWQDLAASGVPVAPSLANAVGIWLSVLNGGYYQWEDNAWQYDYSTVPKELRRSRLLG